MKAEEIQKLIFEKEAELRAFLKDKNNKVISGTIENNPSRVAAFKAGREKWSASRVLKNADLLGL